MALTIHDILRAIIRSDGAKLNDPGWQEQAHAAIDAHEAGPVAAPVPPQEQEAGQ